MHSRMHDFQKALINSFPHFRIREYYVYCENCMIGHFDLILFSVTAIHFYN